MIRTCIFPLLAALLGHAVAQSAETLPPFEEVFGLVSSNLAGAKPDDLNQAALEGLLKELSPRITLVEASSGSNATAAADVGVTAHVFRDSVGYVRLNTVGSGAAGRVKAAFDQLTESNKLSGLVVDLRFADGDDYAAAVAVASLFLADEVPLLNWGEGLKRSQAREDAILLPVATLVNAKTGEAAEALAAMMRQSGVALVIGSRTSGTAGIMESFPLSTGQELRVTVANVQLGDAKSLDTDGVQPDVEVPVSLADEERFVADPSYTPRSQPLTATDANGETNALNAARRSRTDEAELVRRWRGEAPTATGENADSAAETEQIRDPVLLRALDLMEGLAILRSWQR